MNWYLAVLKKYAVFSGRSRRKEYWTFVLVNNIIALILGFIESIAGITPESEWSLLPGLFSLAVLIPGLAVSVRRLHDTGRSGWWLLCPFAFFGIALAAAPFFGGLVSLFSIVFLITSLIILLVFMAQDSHPGENRYGPNPKLNV